MKILPIGHLVKTNPNKPNLVRRPVRRSFSEVGSLGEGGFKPSAPYSGQTILQATGKSGLDIIDM